MAIATLIDFSPASPVLLPTLLTLLPLGLICIANMLYA